MIREPDPETDELARRVIGCAIEVHRNLGPGFLESIYEEALSREFELSGIRHICQYPIRIDYKGKPIGEGRLDFLIQEKLILEIKAVASVLPIHKAQIKSYLKSTGLLLGLLINFNEVRLADGIRRVILSQP